MLDRDNRSPNEVNVAARESLNAGVDNFLRSKGEEGLGQLLSAGRTIVIRLSPNPRLRGQAFPTELQTFIAQQIPDRPAQLSGIEVSYQPNDGDNNGTHRTLVNLKVVTLDEFPSGGQAVRERIVQVTPDTTPIMAGLLSNPLRPQTTQNGISFAKDREQEIETDVLVSIAKVISAPPVILTSSAKVL